ncbi:S8 family peptidase [Motilibacter aurantiacus]|uniref:S8 family peptidase n=1 Tax=Motilibacter aurantiacus TaxID=2714955 RepID=UPI0014094E8D|nr:S8 family peptidase [Motilibacter aurantiacus]NHC45418.1 S8 family peptidase [Motilibacter aurantiacus]
MSKQYAARTWLTAVVSAGIGVAALAAAPGAASAAERPEGVVVNAGTEDAVEGSYIVVLAQEGAAPPSETEEEVREVASDYEAVVEDTFTAAVDGFVATMDARSATELAADPRVDYVEQNQVLSIAATQSPTPAWGLDRIDQPALPLNSSYTYTENGTGVRAYVIDTGIQTNHADLGGRAVNGFDAIGDGRNGQDCNGHGTHVAGTIGGSAYGVAKKASLVGVRVLNCAGSGTTAGVIAGVDYVTANAVKPAVANMSLGGSASAALDEAVRRSIASGITYAIAAGNSSTNACNTSPARTPEALTVGATNVADSRAPFSNVGTCLDLFAPGERITSAWIGAATATNTISGTSMASPHVAGAAALLLQRNPGATPAQVAAALTAAAVPTVSDPGAGSPNRLLQRPASGTPAPPATVTYTNGTDVAIVDLATVSSNIAVAGRSGSTSSVRVTGTVKHTYRGDLVVSLVAPNGQAHVLHDRAGGSADDLALDVVVPVANQPINGLWQLRIQDAAFADSGYLDTWSLIV